MAVSSDLTSSAVSGRYVPFDQRSLRWCAIRLPFGVLSEEVRDGFHGTWRSESRRFTRRWRLVIAEDSDEYLRATARKEAGASLGRLLNLTDGILGDSHQVLVLLTTNEDVGRLHPALTRPGRCLARVEFAPFAPEEARRWLGDEANGEQQASTLAELFEQRGDIETIVDSPHSNAPNGMYL